MSSELFINLRRINIYIFYKFLFLNLLRTISILNFKISFNIDWIFYFAYDKLFIKLLYLRSPDLFRQLIFIAATA